MSYQSHAIGAGDTKIHPCAKGLSYGKDGGGWATYTIRYQHIMVEGKCRVCGETFESMLEMGATLKKGLDTKTE